MDLYKFHSVEINTVFQMIVHNTDQKKTKVCCQSCGNKPRFSK